NFYAACYGYSVATYRNHTLRKTVLRDVLHERLLARQGRMSGSTIRLQATSPEAAASFDSIQVKQCFPRI
ncbi:hypothetical protein, partial [Bradyrhizobium sp. RT5a]|uniref:hypothetical protein n=1 Tax=Bradyrhizobium sp. RT5a TaxID=3156380 RepID=UPI00339AA53A